MKRLTWIAALLVVAAITPAIAFPILSYDTKMEIQRDSSVLVTESIVADFRGDSHHGIYRDIPFSSRDKYGNTYRIRCKLLAVTDENNNPLQHSAGWHSGTLRIKIGDPNTLVDDVRTYVIRYKLLRAVHFFEEHDELYWNAVGTEWEAPIQRSTCVVILRSDAPVGEIRALSYSGIYGSTTSEASSDIPDGHTARFWMTRPLYPGEGMTVVVGWPKGMVQKPEFSQQALWFMTDNGYFFVLPIFLLGLVFLWVRAGRDPDTGRSEMVTYDPPDDLRPAELGALIDETADMRDISASIIDLAVRGYIQITPTVEKGLIFSKSDYTLTLTKPYESVIKNAELSPFEIKLVSGIFDGMDTRQISDLNCEFYTHLPALKNLLYESMLTRRYFTHRPDSVRTGYVITGVVIAASGFIGLILAQALAVVPGWFVSIILCGISLMIASRVMPRKTSKGKNVLLQIKGFEEYISRAERPMIEAQERQGYFETFLPYAMALGIADKWARAFDGLQMQPPKWYEWNDSTFSPTLFAHNLNSATSSWSSTMSSSPRSSGSSSGGSGFSGGGSSGGGGGGGGGGGW